MEKDVNYEHYRGMQRHIDANASRHPLYGPCDGNGLDGSCSACDDLMKSLAESCEEMLDMLEKAQSGVRHPNPSWVFANAANVVREYRGNRA